jgi:two-component system cell cycle response regulator DivK
MLVLIVDDNEKNRKLARDLLGNAGFDTLETATGANALTLAVEHAPDVVLMDLQLPDMDGAQAARMLGANPRTARIPVLATSALPLQGADDWLEAAGFVGWIEKPIRVDRFADEVRRHSERTRV